MTRPAAEYEAALKLIDEGINDCEIGRRLGIPRGTIRDWRRPKYIPKGAERPSSRAYRRPSDCPGCDGVPLDVESYAYLLGLYLGDGCIASCPRGVYRLRIVLDQRYPNILDECYGAMRVMRAGDEGRVSFIHRPGCMEVYSYWKHWSCLFPQHGMGRKHLRPILLHPWQQEVVTNHPDRLLRGLIHSDGWRGTNKVMGAAKKRYYFYPRYQFSNESADIRRIFCRACEEYGVEWRQTNRNTIAVSKRGDVAKLDLVIGLKS
jgi:hypothetical protein